MSEFLFLQKMNFLKSSLRKHSFANPDNFFPPKIRKVSVERLNFVTMWIFFQKCFAQNVPFEIYNIVLTTGARIWRKKSPNNFCWKSRNNKKFMFFPLKQVWHYFLSGAKCFLRTRRMQFCQSCWIFLTRNPKNYSSKMEISWKN